MGWNEVMTEVEDKLIRTIRGEFRPLDGLKVFRIQYPPNEEREGIHQFIELRDRLLAQGWQAQMMSLCDILHQTLIELIGCPEAEITRRLSEMESTHDRQELFLQLSENLPTELANTIITRIGNLPKENIAILIRIGSLYPFVRSSSLVSHLEGRFRCTLILPYPGISLGALLDAPPADPHGGYYRGENIPWR